MAGSSARRVASRVSPPTASPPARPSHPVTWLMRGWNPLARTLTDAREGKLSPKLKFCKAGNLAKNVSRALFPFQLSFQFPGIQLAAFTFAGHIAQNSGLYWPWWWFSMEFFFLKKWNVPHNSEKTAACPNFGWYIAVATAIMACTVRIVPNSRSARKSPKTWCFLCHRILVCKSNSQTNTIIADAYSFEGYYFWPIFLRMSSRK